MRSEIGNVVTKFVKGKGEAMEGKKHLRFSREGLPLTLSLAFPLPFSQQFIAAFPHAHLAGVVSLCMPFTSALTCRRTRLGRL